MGERPDQWYLDALERKHKAQYRAAVFWALAPRVAVLVALIALIVIAFKL
jgi:hypothetical protein